MTQRNSDPVRAHILDRLLSGAFLGLDVAIAWCTQLTHILHWSPLALDAFTAVGAIMVAVLLRPLKLNAHWWCLYRAKRPRSALTAPSLHRGLVR